MNLNTPWNKAIVALILSILTIIDLWFGQSWFGTVNEQWLLILIAFLQPVLVFLIPNSR